jgi:ketosteroid isomerase-like protein
MYKATVRWMIRRNLRRLNQGDHGPALAMYADDATLAFPGDNSWSRQFRTPEASRAPYATHRGRDELEAFMARYVADGIQLEVEDILVNGPPWKARAAVVAHDWVPGRAGRPGADGIDGHDRYQNRAVLYVRTRWGRIVAHEDFEDTERSAAFDRLLEAEAEGASVRSGRAPAAS